MAWKAPPGNPIEVESERYGLSATVRPDGVHLEWRRPRRGRLPAAATSFEQRFCRTRISDFHLGTALSTPRSEPARNIATPSFWRETIRAWRLDRRQSRFRYPERTGGLIFGASLSRIRALEHSPVAQLVERAAVNRQVVGSSPTRGATALLAIRDGMKCPTRIVWSPF